MFTYVAHFDQASVAGFTKDSQAWDIFCILQIVLTSTIVLVSLLDTAGRQFCRQDTH